ncbi:hypothetical protein ACGFX8_34615, partial [Streptomyces sp. NPDC048362]|uniref:hypothetical protein n=1 Tax=Streptomyces sp. NPDC048362 TaxID=3365539 RepID=UPI00371A598C
MVGRGEVLWAEEQSDQAADLRDGQGYQASTYFARKRRPKSARQLRDEELIPLVTAVWEDSGRTYGAP